MRILRPKLNVKLALVNIFARFCIMIGEMVITTIVEPAGDKSAETLLHA